MHVPLVIHHCFCLMSYFMLSGQLTDIYLYIFIYLLHDEILYSDWLEGVQ